MYKRQAQELSERLFGDHMPANMIALGAAFQRGALPLTGQAIEQALRLNGAAVEKNLAAFAWGRACVAAPDEVERATREPEAEAKVPEPSPRERLLIDAVGAEGELLRLLEVRVPELAAYQDRGYAERYTRFVARALAAEQEHAPGHTGLAEAVARNLFKLMAYKDEYEVARLHLEAIPAEGKFWFNLHPPFLRALGMKRKLKLGRWFVPFFRMLRAARGLRGTALDPFGYAKVRRTERELIQEYGELVNDALERLGEATHATAVELCELPDVIRGYEEVKLRNVMLFRKRAEGLRKRLKAGKPAPRAIVMAPPRQETAR